MPMITPTERSITGGELRRRVRRITAGCVALAAIASAALTAGFAWAAADDLDSANSASGSTTTAPSPTSTAPATAPAISAPEATTGAASPAPSTTTLAAPQQAPAAGNGRSHTNSGGS
jgi:hypothetical protein